MKNENVLNNNCSLKNKHEIVNKCCRIQTGLSLNFYCILTLRYLLSPLGFQNNYMFFCLPIQQKQRDKMLFHSKKTFIYQLDLLLTIAKLFMFLSIFSTVLFAKINYINEKSYFGGRTQMPSTIFIFI